MRESFIKIAMKSSSLSSTALDKDSFVVALIMKSFLFQMSDDLHVSIHVNNLK